MDKKSKNIVWQSGLAAPEDRLQLMGQRSYVFWLTGLSGSGKSTLAYSCEKRLIENRHPAFVLDGDNVRHGLNKDLGFSPEDRRENVRRVTQVAALLADAGLIVLTSFISPYREDRARAREIIGGHRFAEIYLDVPLEVCEQRDPKNLYKRARAGEISDFTGLTAPYEPPRNPELAINTAENDLDSCVESIFNYIIKRTQL